MELQKIRNCYNDIVITPTNMKDMLIFKHYTNGHSHYLNKYFRKKVKPLLEAYGIKSFYIIDRTRS